MALFTPTRQEYKVDCQRHRIEGYALNGGVWTCRACGAAQDVHETTEETLARKEFARIKEAALAELDKGVSVVYSGKPGCACGCIGKYSTDQRTRTLIANKIRAQIELATFADPRGLILNQDMFVAIDNDRRDATRSYTAYTDGRTH